MRKSLTLLAVVAIVAGLYFGMAFQHARRMQRTAMYNARVFFERAYSEFERTGTLPPSQPHAQLTAYTNVVVATEVTQQCVLALRWHNFRNDGFLAISTNRTVFWIDHRRPPSIIDSNYRAPLFGSGI